MRINKFKYKEKDGVLIRYEKESKEDKNRFDQYELSSKDEPSGDLKKALQAMGRHVLDICEMNDISGDIKVISVSIPYAGEKEIPGLVITGLRSLSNSNSPMVINTPCFWTDSFSENEDLEYKNLLSQDAINDMKHLISEVEKYISGERAQKEFDFSGEKAS